LLGFAGSIHLDGDDTPETPYLSTSPTEGPTAMAHRDPTATIALDAQGNVTDQSTVTIADPTVYT
jgi:hypothetical protein